ncbi:MAG: hypothetical protein BGO29_14975 [Bacteroidales bacterium 36-12]|nr:MAG: hypothetical protein BGO29_14975 [Bacteroidales bacterium 36-12]
MKNKLTRRDYLLNRIYEELKQANTTRHYAELLIDNQVLNSKLFNIVIAMLSSSGAILYFIETYYAFAATISVAIGTVLNQFFPVFF